MSKEVEKEIDLDSTDKGDTLKDNDTIVDEVHSKLRPDISEIKLPVHTRVQASDYKESLPVSETSKIENEYLEIENEMRWSALYSHLNEVSAKTKPSFSVAERIIQVRSLEC